MHKIDTAEDSCFWAGASEGSRMTSAERRATWTANSVW